MSLTALEQGLTLAWNPESTPGSDQLTGTLTVEGISALPVQVEWGDGQSETIQAPDEQEEA